MRDGKCHRGLAQSARSDDGHEPLGRQLVTDFANDLVAPHHSREQRWQRVVSFRKVVGSRQTRRIPRRRRNEAITAAHHIREIALAAFAGVEGLAQRRDMDPKGDLFDEKPGPNLGHQLPLADHFTRMLDQNEQDIERTAAKLDRLIGLLENAL